MAASAQLDVWLTQAVTAPLMSDEHNGPEGRGLRDTRHALAEATRVELRKILDKSDQALTKGLKGILSRNEYESKWGLIYDAYQDYVIPRAVALALGGMGVKAIQRFTNEIISDRILCTSFDSIDKCIALMMRFSAIEITVNSKPKQLIEQLLREHRSNRPIESPRFEGHNSSQLMWLLYSAS